MPTDPKPEHDFAPGLPQATCRRCGYRMGEIGGPRPCPGKPEWFRGGIDKPLLKKLVEMGKQQQKPDTHEAEERLRRMVLGTLRPRLPSQISPEPDDIRAVLTALSEERKRADVAEQKLAVAYKTREQGVADLRQAYADLHKERQKRKAAEERSTTILHYVQLHQPAGSPPPGGIETLVDWIMRSLAERITEATAAARDATLKLQYLAQTLETEDGTFSFPDGDSIKTKKKGSSQ